MLYRLSRATLFAVACFTACGHESVRAADGPVQRLRMPDPLLSLRDMYPDITTRTVSFAAARDFQLRNSQLRAQGSEFDPLTGQRTLPMSGAWQRLGDYRAPGGERLLTLWRTAGGTVALNAGRHGGPSLQWSSRMSAQETTPVGLFDHLLATGASAVR